MRVYADSSFLVSCYLTDANTPKAKAFLLGHAEPLPFTALHDLEVRNALRLGVFRNVITDEEAKAAVSTIDTDLRSGRLARVSVKWPSAFKAASRLSSKHAATTGTRSLDILHLAAATALRCKELASFDSRQRALASVADMRNAFND
jgi:predicted nucleic acid-binding protein